MKLGLLSGVAAVAFSILAAAPALAQDADFSLVNKTGYPIREVYVSPTKSSSWGNDRLGRHVLDDGASWKFRFPQSRSQCVQDLKVVFDDDSSEVTWDAFDLCDLRKITLYYNRKTDVVSADSE